VIVWRNDKFLVEDIITENFSAVIISPGPRRPSESGHSNQAVRLCIENQIPLLGVCLGHQAIGEYYGAQLVESQRIVHGKASAIKHDGLGVFKDLPEIIDVGRYHSLSLDRSQLSSELVVTAETLDDSEVMGIRHKNLLIEGVQFHPESILTDCGKLIVKNFYDSI